MEWRRGDAVPRSDGARLRATGSGRDQPVTRSYPGRNSRDEVSARGIRFGRLYGWVSNGGRVSEQSRLMTGAMIGALAGVAASYLFFTERGRSLRERMEPAVEDLRREFSRFQKTAEKLGVMANEGMRVVNEFNAARAQPHFGSERTSH